MVVFILEDDSYNVWIAHNTLGAPVIQKGDSPISRETCIRNRKYVT